MRLCLIRHGIAAERGPAWPDDRLRPLTPDGREKMREAARGLARLVLPDIVLSSPLVRARETAEILADAWEHRPIRVCEALATGDDDRLIAEVAATGAHTVAAVGHEPFISSSLSYLLAGPAGQVSSAFRKGAAALVAFEGDPTPGDGILEWLMQPRALRLAGGSSG